MRLLLFILLAFPLFGQSTHDIYVTDKIVVQRAVIGGPTSRMIAVGHPGGFNYAFDATHCAPAYAWYGGFLDFKGETTGRGGKYCNILGIKRPLISEKIQLRLGDPKALPEIIKFSGYRLASSGAPTFLFAIDGTSIEQTITSSKPDTVVIHLNFPDKKTTPAYFHLPQKAHAQITLSESLTWSTPDLIQIPGEIAKITIALKPTTKVFKRKTPKLTGAQIFQNYCATCHSTDGSKLIGPTFKGLAGRQQSITRDGNTETITTDSAYLLESILKPQAAIVKGYENVPMADFSSVLSKPQLTSLVNFLQTLK